MIVFDLKCACGCQFEGWFASHTHFDRQNDAGFVTCPECGCDEIHKILSPVAVHTGKTCQPTAQPTPQADTEMTADTAVQFLRSVQEFVEKNFDDVGPKLAEESLKIHYGIHEPRNIRGVATADEEKMLKKEGIELLKIPVVKKPSDPNVN